MAQRVDGLPLALEQAAAYIVRHRMQLAAYLQAWEGERQRVLQWFDPQVMRYPASVTVTWQHTFQQLTPTAAALLRLTAFLAPDPIPVEIFEQGSKHVEAAAERFCEESGKTPDGKSIQEAVADLAGFSMASQQDGRSFSVHRMVQEALHHQIPENRWKSWIEGALRIVNGATKGDPQDVRTWPLLDRLTAIRLNNLALLLQATNRLREAEPLMQRTVDILERSLGPDHPRTQTGRKNLAILLAEMNPAAGEPDRPTT